MNMTSILRTDQGDRDDRVRLNRVGIHLESSRDPISLPSRSGVDQAPHPNHFGLNPTRCRYNPHILLLLHGPVSTLLAQRLELVAVKIDSIPSTPLVFDPHARVHVKYLQVHLHLLSVA